MRGSGYFATLSGGRAAAAAGVLKPPQRLFAHEPVSVEAPSPPLRPRAAAPPTQPTPTDAPSKLAATLEAASLARRVESSVPELRTPIVPPLTPPLAERPAVPPRSVAALDRVEPAEAEAELVPPAHVREPRRNAVARGAPAARIPLPPTPVTRNTLLATPFRPARTRRAPQVRIGAIEVIVVPPPSPQPPPARTVASRPRPRPARGPDRPAQWFGLAQR